MNIQLDENYRITTDPLNFILEEKRIAQSGKNKGNEIWVNVGYFGTLKPLLKDYIQTSIKNSNIDAIEGLMSRIDEIEENINKCTSTKKIEELTKRVDELEKKVGKRE